VTGSPRQTGPAGDRVDTEANGFRLLTAKVRYCKICDQPSEVYGSIDFPEGPGVPSSDDPAGRAVAYSKCSACGTLFTCSYDNWTDRDFSRFIYNEGFAAIDTAITTGDRARQNARIVEEFFTASKADISVLDFGGAGGAFAEDLRQAGFSDVHTYDPFIGDHSRLPSRSFDLVTAFEVVEHAVRPLTIIRNICELTSKRGAILLSTQVLPDDFETQGLGWWYVNPRVGHVTLYTKQSLGLAFQQCGFKMISCHNGLHIAFREIPVFAKHLLHEGLPAGFDPDSYLRYNPDVKAAGLDPGWHYVRFGWCEGRAW
jgi:2-polyprenyl-6-hydroxyphenyl methylase/3-demethylubiquinone-9 3-methyltransferase